MYARTTGAANAKTAERALCTATHDGGEATGGFDNAAYPAEPQIDTSCN